MDQAQMRAFDYCLGRCVTKKCRLGLQNDLKSSRPKKPSENCQDEKIIFNQWNQWVATNIHLNQHQRLDEEFQYLTEEYKHLTQLINILNCHLFLYSTYPAFLFGCLFLITSLIRGEKGIGLTFTGYRSIKIFK